jgi:Flp pilus assembly protein TadG
MIRRRHRETGGASLELVLLTPVFLVLLLLVVAGGRLALARERVDAAARDAARSGTIARTAEQARADAINAATARLEDEGVTCRSLDVVVDTQEFAPGGSVTATVTCTVDLGDLTLLGMPGSRTVTSTAVETVDRFRGTDA